MLIDCCHPSAKELLLLDYLAVGACAIIGHIGIEEAVMQEERWRCGAEGERELRFLSILAICHLRLELQKFQFHKGAIRTHCR